MVVEEWRHVNRQDHQIHAWECPPLIVNPDLRRLPGKLNLFSGPAPRVPSHMLVPEPQFPIRQTPPSSPASEPGSPILTPPNLVTALPHLRTLQFQTSSSLFQANSPFVPTPGSTRDFRGHSFYVSHVQHSSQTLEWGFPVNVLR